MSIVRLNAVTREVGTFVILDEIVAAIALGDRIGLVGPNGAGKTTLLRLIAGRDEPDSGEVSRKRGLTIGLLSQEAHFDAVFMAAPDLRTAVRSGAAHLDRMAETLAAFERDGRAGEPAYADLQHEYDVLGGYTLDLRVDSALERARLREGRMGEAAVGDVRRGADPGVARPPRDRRPRPAAARRAHQPPRPRRARMARGPPAQAPRLAAGGLARPGVPRRGRDPDLGAARPQADRVPRRLQRVSPPARGARRPGRQGRRHHRRVDRPRARARPALPEPPQVLEDARARGPPREAPRREAGGPEGRSPAGDPDRLARRRRPDAIRRDRRPDRGPRRRLPAGPWRGDGRRQPGVGAADRGAGAVPRGPARRAHRHRRARTARARPRSCARSPGSCRRSTGRSRSGTRSSWATWRSSAARRSRGRPCSTP